MKQCWIRYSYLQNPPFVLSSRSGGHEFESPMRCELSALTKSGKTLGVRSFYSGDPDVTFEHAADVITWSCQSVWLCNPCILTGHWKTHFPDTKADNTSLLNQPHVGDWREHCREACQDTETSIRLASHLVRAFNSRSGGREFEFPIRQELGALTKCGKTLGVRSCYRIIFSFTNSTNTCTCRQLPGMVHNILRTISVRNIFKTTIKQVTIQI
jgi:hypothetical protein